MTDSRIILVINGPNLALLGLREPQIYGKTTQDELINLVDARACGAGFKLEFFQSDIEGEIVERIGKAAGSTAGLVINPGGYSHYSIAIMDAMKAYPGPVVEVHLSQVFSRESFRGNLVTARAADALICGAGLQGYLHAVDMVSAIPA